MSISSWYGPYLHDMVSDFIKSDAWKIQLIMKISFMSSKDIGEKCLMNYKNENKKNHDWCWGKRII